MIVSYLPPIIYRVEEQDDGIMLRTILRDRMKLSRKLLSRLKQSEQGIILNGERVYTSVKVKRGDQVEVRMPREISEDILPEDIPFDIVFEDEHLLIVNKAAGIIVHPTHGHYTGTLANGVVHYWKSKGEDVRFRPIHRLDQYTSGVLAIAKNPYVHQHVSEQMKRNKVDKTYIAFVHGRLVPSAGTIAAPIDRSEENPHIRTVREDGYPSVTHYTTIDNYEEAASLVRIRLETGRTHQIRVHMKSIHAPLIGDAMYGPDSYDEGLLSIHGWINRQALHAETLAFVHPITGKHVTFEAPWPDDLQQLRNHFTQVYVEREKDEYEKS